MEKTITKPRIRVRRTEMDFQHEGKTLTAVHPFYGPANSRTLQNLIRKEGYIEPISAQLTSFVHEYFGGSEQQVQEVTQISRDGYFRGFTGILYIPEEGLAYFIDYPEFDINSHVNKENLLKRLDESRARVSFKHLKEGSVDWRKVAKHPYFVAWAGGEEGAEKLAELASKSKKAYIGVPNVSNLKEPIARVASLGFYLSGYVWGVDSGGCGDLESSSAFGVQKIKQ